MLKSSKILLIEDSLSARELATLKLKKHGFEIICLSSGESSLELIKIEKPDLVLLDVMNPAENGNVTLQKIRDVYSAVELPIIMVTSNANSTDVTYSLSLGANDYITKPVDFDVAVKRIETHLRLKELSERMSKLKELEAVKALVATYNHEINNPLTIALGKLDLYKSENKEDPNLQIVEDSLWRISDIIKKIQKLLQAQSLDFEEYDKHCDMLKIDK